MHKVVVSTPGQSDEIQTTPGMIEHANKVSLHTQIADPTQKGRVVAKFFGGIFNQVREISVQEPEQAFAQIQMV